MQFSSSEKKKQSPDISEIEKEIDEIQEETEKIQEKIETLLDKNPHISASLAEFSKKRPQVIQKESESESQNEEDSSSKMEIDEENEQETKKQEEIKQQTTSLQTPKTSSCEQTILKIAEHLQLMNFLIERYFETHKFTFEKEMETIAKQSEIINFKQKLSFKKNKYYAEQLQQKKSRGNSISGSSGITSPIDSFGGGPSSVVTIDFDQTTVTTTASNTGTSNTVFSADQATKMREIEEMAEEEAYIIDNTLGLTSKRIVEGLNDIKTMMQILDSIQMNYNAYLKAVRTYFENLEILNKEQPFLAQKINSEVLNENFFAEISSRIEILKIGVKRLYDQRRNEMFS